MTDKLDEAALEKAAARFEDWMDDATSAGYLDFCSTATSDIIQAYLTETKLLEKLEAAEVGLERIYENNWHDPLPMSSVAKQTLKQIRGKDD